MKQMTTEWAASVGRDGYFKAMLFVRLFLQVMFINPIGFMCIHTFFRFCVAFVHVWEK